MNHHAENGGTIIKLSERRKTQWHSRLPRILVVEDDMLLGMDLAMQLEDWGFEVDGPHPSSGRALEALTIAHPDLAILDVNLGSAGNSFPVAQTLQERRIPYLFLTGYSGSSLELLHGGPVQAPRLSKPFDASQLRAAISNLLPG